MARRARSKAHRSHLLLERYRLAGAFNSSLLKAARSFFADNRGAESRSLSRPQSRDFYRRRGAKIPRNTSISPLVLYQDAAQSLASDRRYRMAKRMRSSSSTTNSKSVMSQKLSHAVLPVALADPKRVRLHHGNRRRMLTG